MGFNKVAVTRKNTAGWKRVWSKERTMSNSRLLATAATWTIALAAIYCSFFYIPAFYDFKNAIGVTSAQLDVEKEDRFYSPLVDLLSQNQGYMMSGQSMEAQYKIKGASSGTLVVYACQSPVIVEIVKCDPAVVKEIPLRRSEGKYAVRVGEAGFYGFTIRLNDEESDFYMIWRRIYT